MSSAVAVHSEHCPVYTVVLDWEACDPLLPVHSHTFPTRPAASRPCSRFSTRMSKRLCLQSIQRPEGEVVKPPVLTSALPEGGSGGSRSGKEGHLIEAPALGVGKDS